MTSPAYAFTDAFTEYLRIVRETLEEDGLRQSIVDEVVGLLTENYYEFAAGGFKHQRNLPLWGPEVRINNAFRVRCERSARRDLQFIVEIAELLLIRAEERARLS